MMMIVIMGDGVESTFEEGIAFQDPDRTEIKTDE